jgi:hypothetical protein
MAEICRGAARWCDPVFFHATRPHRPPLAHPTPPPRQATSRRVEQWVRLRLRQAGLPRPESVFTVSAVNGLGVKEMLGKIRDEMGFRADLWVVGAQNGGLLAGGSRFGWRLLVCWLLGP